MCIIPYLSLKAYRLNSTTDTGVCLSRCVCVGDLLYGPAAILLAGERSGDQSAGVWSSTPQTPALPTYTLRPALSLLGLRATCPAQFLPACLLPQVHKQSEHCFSLLLSYTLPNTRTLYAFTDVCVFDSDIHRIELEQEMDVGQSRSHSTLSPAAPDLIEPPPKVQNLSSCVDGN